MLDVGILATGIAAALAFLPGRGKWLRHLLLISWTATAVATAMGMPMAGFVFIMTMLDLTIALAALAISTHDNSRLDARIVGGVSMALMPMHWVMAWSEGAASWTLYAAACNAGFILQCLIVGGWLDGVGRGVSRFLRRVRPLHFLRGGER